MDGALKIASITPAGLAVIMIVLGASAQAPAQTDEQPRPVAIIEAFDDGSGRDRAFEILKQDTVLKLGTSGTAVIGYFQSCIQETIEGGVVTIGLEQSKIRGGIVTRERAECDGSKLVLTPEQLAASAVTVDRGPDGVSVPGVVTVYSTKPYIMLKDPGATVVVRRADVAGEPTAIETVKIGASRNIHVPKKPLHPGAVYRVTAGDELLSKVVYGFVMRRRDPGVLHSRI